MPTRELPWIILKQFPIIPSQTLLSILGCTGQAKVLTCRCRLGYNFVQNAVGVLDFRGVALLGLVHERLDTCREAGLADRCQLGAVDHLSLAVVCYERGEVFEGGAA